MSSLNELPRLANVDELEKYREEAIKQQDLDGPSIIVCCGTGCQANSSKEVAEALRESLKKFNAPGKVVPGIKETGCHGFCSRGPLVVIKPQDIFYQKVSTKDADKIVQDTILEGKLIKKLQYKRPDTKKVAPYLSEIPFYSLQNRIVLQKVGRIDPYDVNDAIALGAYKALNQALTSMKKEEVVEEVKKSGLRGRGGAGFPAGVKWASCARYDGDRYIICNADEGDPGAFMDRSILEGDPHSVIEGMVLAGYAVGSSEGYVYARFEYPLAVDTMRKAIAQAESLGLLGDNILGTGFNFHLKVSTGAGAFVCGESSALMKSLEGKVGRPRAKYVRSVEKGFRESPSCLNNVETFANIPDIVTKGGDWYASYGTKKSTGTKVFALTGDITNIGLVEIPMGTPLKQVVDDIGGGVPNKKKLKAVQTGGPSGGCIPTHLMDIPVDFENLDEVGSIVGSGGMIVMDENTCMVDVATYFVKFLTEESCGQCTPCRDGLKQMYEILDNIREGKGKEEDIDLLIEMGEAMQNFSLCGLGTSAANPVLSTIKYFKEEYLTHIKNKFCPAGICKKLFHYEIDAESCTGCTLCAKACPTDIISGEKKKPHEIDVSNCIICGECYSACHFNSVKITPNESPST